jgi:hypothetical protein
VNDLGIIIYSFRSHFSPSTRRLILGCAPAISGARPNQFRRHRRTRTAERLTASEIMPSAYWGATH